MLIENTNLCEKALLAEAAKEKLERKLNELTEECNQTIDKINTSEDDSQKTDVVNYLKEIKTKLEDLQSMNVRTNEELIDHEIKASFVTDGDHDKMDNDALFNEEQAALEEEKRAIGQVGICFVFSPNFKH